MARGSTDNKGNVKAEESNVAKDKCVAMSKEEQCMRDGPSKDKYIGVGTFIKSHRFPGGICYAGCQYGPDLM